MSWRIRASALAAAAVCVCVAATARAQPRREVTAAVLRDWPPYYTADGDGRPTGFGVDTMDAVAERAGLDVRYRVYETFPDAIHALERGEVDLVPNLGIVESREELLDFTSPLDVFDVAIFVRVGTEGIEGIEDLAGHRVAVVESNVGVELMSPRQDVDVVVYDDVRTALYELLAGRVDALVFPRPVILALARRADVRDKIEAVGPPLREVRRGIAVRAGDELLARLEPAVTDLAGSPEYAAMYDEWLGHEPAFWNVTRVMTVAGAVVALTLLLVLLWRHRVHRRIADEIRGRRQAEERRESTEGRYQKLMEQASDGIFISDEQGRYTEVNRRGCELVGYSREQLVGMRLTDLLTEEELRRRPLALDALEPGRVMLARRNLLRSDGTTVPVEISATQLADGSYQGIVRDISERLEAETAIRDRDEQLRQSQKMEAIGRLAGGVAHDFNNLLTVILGNGHALRDELDGQERMLLDEMLQASERAADLTRQLLAFSRKQVVSLEPIDVTVVLHELNRMLERIIGEDVLLSIDTPEVPCTIVADRAQLEQVLLNLAVNARDAMPSGGELSIRCAVDDEDDDRWVLIEVRDTGHGMQEDTRAHAFEPFYTTKEPGQGTGLGLATVHSIVEQAGGRIELDSSPGRGAIFRIYWPRHQGSVGDGVETELPSPPPERPLRTLVVEDEDGVRRVVVRSLARAGFDVTEASRPQEALALCRDGLEVDLLLTDIVMPSMSGVELADHVQKVIPRLKVVFMSGYPQRSLDDALEPEGRAFLPKPFTNADLLKTIADVFDGGAGHERARAAD